MTVVYEIRTSPDGLGQGPVVAAGEVEAEGRETPEIAAAVVSAVGLTADGPPLQHVLRLRADGELVHTHTFDVTGGA